ncbi:MAG TPA: EamA family transporter [Terriglobales bacterium]
MTLRKYLVLACVTVFGAVGDPLLSIGMRQIGGLSLHNFSTLILAVFNPWVASGVVLLLGFFAAYLTALSWADLTYVLPATSLAYVVLALVARFLLHEHISATRWAGIVLISVGVAFVMRGPALSPEAKALGAEERMAEISSEAQ